MRKRLFLGILILSLFPMIHLSAEVLSLDRELCLSLALENNSGLLKEALSLETARRAENASWNVFLPKVSTSLNGSASITTGTTSLSPGLSVSYTFTPGLNESINQLKLQLERSEINYESLRQQLIVNVEREFYYLLTSQHNLEIQEKNIELARRRYEQTEVKYKNGLTSEITVLQEKVNYANMGPAYSSLQSAYKNRIKEFLVVLGVDPLSDVELIGDLEVEAREFSADVLIEKYLDNRADIQAQQNQLKALESSLRQTRSAGHFPSISLSASWKAYVMDPFSASSWENFFLTDDYSISLMIALGLDNYIPGSSTDLQIKKVEDSVAQAKITLKTLIQNAQLEIINLVDSLNTDRENLELSRLNLELSETSYQMTEESYIRGKSDRLTLDDAQQNLLKARQNLLESQYQYTKDLITLRGALGVESLNELEGISSNVQ